MRNGFTDLSKDGEALSAVLSRMGLIAPGQPFEAETLTGGVSSTVLKISSAGRVFCLKQALPKLKVAKDWRVPVDRVFGEIDWLTTVSSIAPEAVPAVCGVDRDSRCFAMEFLPEEAYPNWKSLLMRGRVDAGFAAAVCAALGLIHARTAADPVLAGRFATDANFYAIRLEPYLAETARNHPRLAPRILEVLERTRTTKLVLVHGDVSPKNILVGRKGPVFLDAECAWYGDPAFDLAFCLNHLLLKAVHNPAAAPSLLAAFAASAAAYLDHVGWEPRDRFEERAAALLPCLMLARVDGKSPVEYLADAGRALVRTLAVAMIDRRPIALDQIAAFVRKEMTS